MKKHHFICTIAVLLAMVANVQAQEERNKSLINSYLHGWEYNIKAGFNIGGTSPIPPAQGDTQDRQLRTGYRHCHRR